MVWEDIFLSYNSFLNFKKGWKERSLTHERQFLTKDLDKYNPAVLEQFTKKKG